ncbi:MAG TPA: ERF family protein [Nitrospira sp.]|nr:ERF family protein [Nitrospira sp.]HNG02006.1 ERF family protein [Nitrospira sp.]
MNVYQRLNQAREKFHSLKLEKTGHNKFAGYYYFELGDFLVPALKVFRDAGLCATVSFNTDNACMTIRNVEKPEEFLSIYSPMGSAALKGCHEVQNIGAVETYQRRYLWVAALEIVEHDALDATTGKDKPEPKKAFAAPHKPTDGAMESLPQDQQEYIRELAADVVEVMKSCGQAEAFDRIEIEQLDNMQMVALWSLLDSKTRSALKVEKGLRIGAA